MRVSGTSTKLLLALQAAAAVRRHHHGRGFHTLSKPGRGRNPPGLLPRRGQHSGVFIN